ncbi:hypothetical protein E6W39_01355 [Kitasatospora acidiphila]|uniref:Uncharacterized protein n=1 Tax=Kitasatospora acidiphila TaxID=2567942 RepID=A0A540VWJ0_9ACTN|nr:hypothetical protein [Kitasatospora acidiphila]TQF01131.1 hypothetical protein E6W39_01355 [Kitasatospora acidiphila]
MRQSSMRCDCWCVLQASTIIADAAYKQVRAFRRTGDRARAAYKIGNTATALGVTPTVFERHLAELADGWFDATTGELDRAGTAPVGNHPRHPCLVTWGSSSSSSAEVSRGSVAGTLTFAWGRVAWRGTVGLRSLVIDAWSWLNYEPIVTDPRGPGWRAFPQPAATWVPDEDLARLAA